MKMVLPSMAISSSVSRQSETKPGLKTDLVPAFIQLKRFSQQPAGFLALAVVGVAFLQSVTRHSVETHHQFVGITRFPPVVAYILRQRGYVARMIVVMLHRPQGGCVAHRSQLCKYFIECRRG